MAVHTKRDDVWTAALTLAGREEAFTLFDVYDECPDATPSERTVRDVLTTMAAEDWLEKETAADDGSRLYGPGARFRRAFE